MTRTVHALVEDAARAPDDIADGRAVCTLTKAGVAVALPDRRGGSACADLPRGLPFRS